MALNGELGVTLAARVALWPMLWLMAHGAIGALIVCLPFEPFRFSIIHSVSLVEPSPALLADESENDVCFRSLLLGAMLPHKVS